MDQPKIQALPPHEQNFRQSQPANQNHSQLSAHPSNETHPANPPRQEPQIAIDMRESPEYAKILSSLGAQIQIQTLSIADFILSQRCAAERKTRADFEASIIDGRLFEQAARLKAAYEKPLLIIEGSPNSDSRIQKPALLGAYAALITDYSLPLFFTQHISSTCQLLYSLAKYEQISKKNPLRVQARKKAFTPEQVQLATIESLPKVGPKLAKSLLSHFHTPKKVFSATQKQLLKVPGLGEARAQLIFTTINSVYSTKNEG
ncbi:MAG: ERCC4 domain-containing protein [Candidatus Micrarchaeota archaeon]